MAFARGMSFWLAAFVFAYAIWLIHDDSAKAPELLAGVVVAALAATATELVRRQRVAQMRVRPSFLRSAWRLPWSAARDSVALTVMAARQLVDPQPARGRTVALPFRHGGDEPEANARRALTDGLGSFAPGTIVVGVDPDAGVVLAHQLAADPTPSNLDPLELG
jgi:multisubunit Na+/H+ antiporter MnhE subunit